MKNKPIIFGTAATIIIVSIFLVNFMNSGKIEIPNNSPNPDHNSKSSIYTVDSLQVSTKTINGSINNITKINDSNSIVVEINPLDKGYLLIKIPQKMLKAINDDYTKFSFFVISDGEETAYEQLDSETIKINFQNDTRKIEIIGASRLN